MPDPVVLLSGISDITVHEGELLELPLSVRSNPVASFEWRYFDQLVDNNYTLSYVYTRQAIYDVYKNEKLTLTPGKVTRDRAGLYQVEADNRIGNSIVDQAWVQIYCKFSDHFNM